MKFRFFSIFALAGLLLGSCAVDELPTEGGSIIAEMETDQTRTAVTDEGTFTWSAGDKVWLHTTSGSVVGTLSDGAGSSSAKFTYGGFVGEMTGKAVYPYNDGHSIDGEVLNFVLPASYDLGSSLTNTNAAMYGVNVGETIKFNHLAGVMRFKFKDVPAGVNKFTITLDKKVNGTFSADLTADYPVIETSATSTASEKTITLNFNALTAKSDICVYVPLPTGTYNSLELGLYDDDQSVWTYSKSVTNTVNRKSLKLMPVVTIGGSVDGDLEGGDSEKIIDYVDEYGVNHGPGVKIDGTVWAPVNCGYHKDDFKYGKLYQWGRKYGQGYNGELYDGDWDQTYSDVEIPTISDDSMTLADGESLINANVFKIGFSKYDYDWIYPHHRDLWNCGTKESPIKTEYDPCPDGWRVPTYTELKGLTANQSSGIENEGQKGAWFSGTNPYSADIPQVFLPSSGERLGKSGETRYRGSIGCYWSSNYNGDYANYIVMASNVPAVGYYTQRSNGYSVRCVQDDREFIPVDELILGTSTISMIEKDTYIVKPTICPANANHQNIIWWSDNDAVATVDHNGKITAILAGRTTIMAMAGMQTAKCDVTVEPKSKIDYIDEYGINHGNGIKIGANIWAPVNCGYHATDFQYGKLYQWGRKYGQGYNGPIYDTEGNKLGRYSDAELPVIETGPVSLDEGQLETNADKFYYNSSIYQSDWCTPQDETLWNKGTASEPIKTEFDPCPSGWRVPTLDELSELSENYSSWSIYENQNGFWFSGRTSYAADALQVFLPAAGKRFYLTSGCTNRGNGCSYWSSARCSSNISDVDAAWILTTDENTIGMSFSGNSADGCSVRCIQE